ncbi:hypothetical protein G6O67_001572 [Ophiocordyceps sinensis]|uniref:Uncharacterized protein n=1 Tax=Ophiocordyceps sinensis TaxID=72228 RepID=A0A8H4V8Y8_9HYPO|nr:hypothetical protein G6O67_001572 [Ophiocordyceps sinensis]
MSQNLFPTQIITNPGNGIVRHCWKRNVDEQRASYAPVGRQSTEEVKQGEKPPMWIANVIEYPILSPSPDGVTRHVFQVYTPTRQELERYGLLAPEHDSANPYPPSDPRFLPTELEYRRLASTPNKLLTTTLRLDGGGNRDQYEMGGPYSSFLPKFWHGMKTLLGHQMWAFFLDFEVEPPLNVGYWARPPLCGRPMDVLSPRGETMLDSVQMWLAHGQDQPMTSYHFCFPDPSTETFVALDTIAVAYEGDFETHSGQVMESRFRIKLRCHEPVMFWPPVTPR